MRIDLITKIKVLLLNTLSKFTVNSNLIVLNSKTYMTNLKGKTKTISKMVQGILLKLLTDLNKIYIMKYWKFQNFFLQLYK